VERAKKVTEYDDLADWMNPEVNATRRAGSVVPKYLLDSIQRGHFLYTYKGIPLLKIRSIGRSIPCYSGKCAPTQ
jgi:hypothetical protein